MKIVAYKCPDTGDIFEKKSEYDSHRRRIKVRLLNEKKRDRDLSEFKSWISDQKSSICHVDMIGPWILKNQETIMSWYNLLVEKNTFKIGFDFIESIVFRITYTPALSNSHICPETGVTNWGGIEKSWPRSYPGFKGEVVLVAKKNSNPSLQFPIADFFRFIRIYVHGGGGNKSGLCMSWTELFLDDWPSLSQQLVAEKLSLN